MPRSVLSMPFFRASLWMGGFVLALVLCLQFAGVVGVHNDFTQNAWMPARLVLEGANPYNPSRTEVASVLGAYNAEFSGFNGGSRYFFIYPMWVAVFFLPLGAMPLILATAVWRAANILLLVWGIGSILKSSNPVFRSSKPVAFAAVALVVFLCLLYRESINTLVGGQFAIVELGLLAAVWGWLASSAGKVSSRLIVGDSLAGLALAVLATKPQSVGLAVVLIGLWALARRRYAIPVAGLLSLTLLLGLPLFVYPHSLSDWLAIVLGGQAGSQAEVSASVWGVSYALLGGASLWKGVALALSLAGLLLLLPFWRRDLRDRQVPLPLSLPITLCINSVISPYLLGYEQVLLLFPAVVLLAASGLTNDRPVAENAGRLRSGLIVWLGLLPLVLVPIQIFLKAEYPLVVQSATMLAVCLLVRLNWTGHAQSVERAALPG